jgi:hypothetical protein
MSSLTKLVEKFIYKQSKITISDVRRLADYFGYTERRKPGSEYVFHKKGSYPFTAPTIKGKYVKKEYVKRIARILELEEYLENSKGD